MNTGIHKIQQLTKQVNSIINNGTMHLQLIFPDKTFSDFVGALPEKECRYAVLDYEWEEKGQGHDRICFISW